MSAVRVETGVAHPTSDTAAKGLAVSEFMFVKTQRLMPTWLSLFHTSTHQQKCFSFNNPSPSIGSLLYTILGLSNNDIRKILKRKVS